MNEAYLMFGKCISMQLPSLKDKNVLMMIHIHSYWVEAFPCPRVTATAVTKLLPERSFAARKILSPTRKGEPIPLDKFYTSYVKLGRYCRIVIVLSIPHPLVLSNKLTRSVKFNW